MGIVYTQAEREEWVGPSASVLPQRAVYVAVRARGYVQGAPAVELVGQLLKAIEEICELGRAVTHDPFFETVGAEAGRRFDEGGWPAARVDEVDEDAHGRTRTNMDGALGPKVGVWDKVVRELADSVVPLLVAAQLVEMMSGRRVDLGREALSKAQRDVERGRRENLT